MCVIAGVDGRDEKLCRSLAIYDAKHFKTAGELGCTLAHLQAIQYVLYQKACLE